MPHQRIESRAGRGTVEDQLGAEALKAFLERGGNECLPQTQTAQRQIVGPTSPLVDDQERKSGLEESGESIEED